MTLYTLRVPGDAPGDESLRGPAWPGSGDLDAARLEVTAVVPLAGVPTGAAVLKGRTGPAGAHGGGDGGPAPPPARDALVLSFRDAKAVVLDWDPVACAPVPTSLHSFEGGGGGEEEEGAAGPALPAVAADPGGGRSVWPRPPSVAADPDGRLAAVSYYGTALALLPPVDADALDAVLGGGQGGGGDGAPRPTSVGNATLLDLATLPGNLGIREVTCVSFAHRCAAPTLLVLHAATASWPGIARGAAGGGGPAGNTGTAAAGGPDGAALVALALDPAGRVPPTPLWRVAGLPSVSRGLAPAPGGGVLVLAHRLLVWVPPGGGGGGE